MLKRIFTTILILFAYVLAGCSPVAVTPEFPATPPVIATLASPPTPSITETALSSQPTAYPQPPAPRPTAYPPPAPTPRPSPTPGKQLYLDPGGRYQVELPEDWQPGDQPGAYAGPDGYFRAGDLPEMGFYSQAYQVCMRLVQNLTEPTAPLMSPIPANIGSCQVVPIPYQDPVWARFVVKAPGVPPEKRYFYFEVDGGHATQIAASLQMLIPSSLDDVSAFPSGPLRPADQAFWDAPRLPAVDLPVTETRLEIPEGEISSISSLVNYVPRELWMSQWVSTPTATPDPLVATNQVLARFGYELRQSTAEEHGLYDLYQDGEIISEKIIIQQEPILSASERDLAFPFYSSGLKILRSSGIQPWKNEWGMPEREFRFLGEDLLVPFWNSHYSSIDLLEEGRTVYQFGTFFGANSGLETFQVWQGHWLLEIRGFLIQDGEILNDQLKFEEIFNWQLIHGKPFFFFRKGPRVGISYDGQVLPVYYDDVAHYWCCGSAASNPHNNGNFISFFAQRDGAWYFVQAGR